MGGGKGVAGGRPGRRPKWTDRRGADNVTGGGKEEKGGLNTRGQREGAGRSVRLGGVGGRER